MNDQVWWYATRAAGLMTWSTAVASVIVGLLLSTRAVKSRTGPWMLDLHRFLGGVSVLFLAVHVVTLYFDSFVEFGPREMFIPGESTWNTEAAAWGIIAMYALVLVELTSLLRKHLSQSVWRTFHMLSVVAAVAGTYHAFLGGTDVDNPLTWVIAGAGSAIVIALVALRLKGSSGETTDRSTVKANDREALLKEMRDRLETLPVREDAPIAEVTGDGSTLPRREPTTVAPESDPSTAAPRPPASPFATGANPFAATPPAADPFRAAPPAADPFAAARPAADPFTAAPPAADPFTAAPPAADPFTAAPPAADPFTASEPTPLEPEPFLDPADLSAPEAFDPPAPALPRLNPFAAPPAVASEPDAPAADPVSPFGSEAPPSPFETAPAAPTADVDVPKPLEPLPTRKPTPRAAPNAEPFAAVPAAAPATDPFARPPARDAAPTAPAYAPFATSAPAPTTPVATATTPPPPPLPDAVDPVTGEPDQAAYSAWLVEWLAYAEKYGEETPDDPNRAG